MADALRVVDVQEEGREGRLLLLVEVPAGSPLGVLLGRLRTQLRQDVQQGLPTNWCS